MLMQFAGKAVEVKAHDATDVLAEIVAAFETRLALAAGHRAIHDDVVARLEIAHAFAQRRRFRPDASAPIASGSLRLANAMPRKPQTSMWFESNSAHANLYLAGRRRRRCGHVRQVPACGQQQA